MTFRWSLQMTYRGSTDEVKMKYRWNIDESIDEVQKMYR